jgi:hypothetical protein
LDEFMGRWQKELLQKFRKCAVRLSTDEMHTVRWHGRILARENNTCRACGKRIRMALVREKSEIASGGVGQ